MSDQQNQIRHQQEPSQFLFPGYCPSRARLLSARQQEPSQFLFPGYCPSRARLLSARQQGPSQFLFPGYCLSRVSRARLLSARQQGPSRFLFPVYCLSRSRFLSGRQQGPSQFLFPGHCLSRARLLSARQQGLSQSQRYSRYCPMVLFHHQPRLLYSVRKQLWSRSLPYWADRTVWFRQLPALSGVWRLPQPMRPHSPLRRRNTSGLRFC